MIRTETSSEDAWRVSEGEKGVESASLRNSFISLLLFGETCRGVCPHRLESPADISFSSRACVNATYQTPPRKTRADSPKMTQPMRGDQAHQPAPARKSGSLSSPNAARRLYRNLSGKFRVGTNPPALEDSVVSGRGGDKERLRKTTIFQSNEALFEAVEHQELDLVQLLLSQYSLEELDHNTPNSEGLLPLDIAIMTNNVPMAKLLLRAGAKESPHCE
ncbi:hypothetical protein NQZ68_031715 [Dissostichus eleginoides]|nr:hypothetical protein NQZ68_031715 [Dissostichus eleginoides]